MNVNKQYVVIVLAILAVSGASGVVAGDEHTTTPTPSDNSTTTANSTPTVTSTPTETPREDSASTTRTTETGESPQEQVKDTITGEESTPTPDSNSESGGQDCIQVVVNNGNTSTKECVPRYYHRVDPATEIVAVDWDEDVVTIVIDSERPQQVTVVDTNSIESSGSGDVTYAQETLSSGRNVIRIQATEESGDKTLTVGTSADLDYISNPGEPFLSDGLRTSLLYMSALGGSLGSLIVATLYAYYRWRKLQKGWTDVLKEYKP